LASRGYEHTGITDYSQSPKIPKGVPLKDLWKQIRFIDRLNQRLDLSAENARAAATAGVLIAVSTDAHSTREFGLVSYGLDQARRAGLVRSHPDCLPWKKLAPLLKR
jgi:histidinol phosphatase-like PHP family hydrolase